MVSTKPRNALSNVTTGLVKTVTTLPISSPVTDVNYTDLFGALRMSDSGKKFILCMIDALTKYVELVPLPNTVANAIFEKWYCRFGAPLDIVTKTKARNFAQSFR
jgi:hypothetical protein